MREEKDKLIEAINAGRVARALKLRETWAKEDKQREQLDEAVEQALQLLDELRTVDIRFDAGWKQADRDQMSRHELFVSAVRLPTRPNLLINHRTIKFKFGQKVAVICIGPAHSNPVMWSCRIEKGNSYEEGFSKQCLSLSELSEWLASVVNRYEVVDEATIDTLLPKPPTPGRSRIVDLTITDNKNGD